MEAIFKIQAHEFDEELFAQIKKMIEGKSVTIIISSELDESLYLSTYDANRKHLLKNMASEPLVSFTPDEFQKHVDLLISQSEKKAK